MGRSAQILRGLTRVVKMDRDFSGAFPSPADRFWNPRNEDYPSRSRPQGVPHYANAGGEDHRARHVPGLRAAHWQGGRSRSRCNTRAHHWLRMYRDLE